MLPWHSLSASRAARRLALPWSSQVWDSSSQPWDCPSIPSPLLQYPQAYRAARMGILSVEKKKLHTPYQALSAILRLTTPKKPSLLRRHLYPQQNTMLVPRRDFPYIREASNLPTLHRRCWQEECFSAWRRLWHEHHACWFPNMDHSPMDLNPHAHSLIMFLTWCKTEFNLFIPLTGY